MPTLYDEVPARRILGRQLRNTFHDRDNLPAIPDAVATAEAILRRARDFGPSPTEAVRRLFDSECKRAAAQLTPDERSRVTAFDAAVGIGFGPVVRR